MKIKKLAAILAMFSIGITAMPVTENILPETSIFVRAEEEIPTSGICGTYGENEADVKWDFDEFTGTLTISGTGGITDYPTWGEFSDKIIEVIIENGVTSIGNSAFYGCSSLTSVTIPESVTSIGEDAFRDTGLTSVTIPDSVTSIGNSAFSGCENLISITIPGSVINIGSNAFSGCKSLTSVTIENPDCEIYNYSSTFCNDDAGEDNFFTGTIYGYENSTAQAYAEMWDYNFQIIGTAPESIQGDADGDGAFSVADIIALQKFLLNAGSLKNDKNCDYLKDDIIDIYDLALMKNALLAQ